MPIKKPAAGPTAPAASASAGRKPWRKKTPVEVVMEQTQKLKDQIAEREKEIQDLRKQLQKFEEARKIFESA